MKHLFIVILATSVHASAGVKDLAKWTTDSGSVQAKLNELLRNAKAADETSEFPNEFIKRVGTSYVVGTKDLSLRCEEGSPGMLAVQQYRCVLKGDATKWIVSSASVPAVLHTLFREAHDNNDRDVRKEGRMYVLKDSNTTISCDSHSMGMMAVQGYSCTIE